MKCKLCAHLVGSKFCRLDGAIFFALIIKTTLNPGNMAYLWYASCKRGAVNRASLILGNNSSLSFGRNPCLALPPAIQPCLLALIRRYIGHRFLFSNLQVERHSTYVALYSSKRKKRSHSCSLCQRPSLQISYHKEEQKLLIVSIQ